MKPLLPLALITVLFTASVWAQHARDTHAPTGSSAAGPYDFAARGAFQEMVRKRDFAPKALLAEVLLAGATEGVGALSGLRGEVTILGGRLIVSCGSKATCAPPQQETATLLATAKVRGWRAGIALPRDMDEAQVGEFADAQARAAGLNLSEPFPLRISGPLASARMHVVSSPNPAFAGHGGGHPMAIQDEERASDAVGGEVLGMRVPAALQGIATHPGEAFHFHWVDSTRNRTTHLDGFRVKAGALLLLPAP